MELRQLTSTDSTAWSQLIATAFNRTLEEAAAVWRWLHANHDLVAWGAWEGEHLAAQYSCLLRPLYLPTTQSTHSVGISTNMAVDPAYRGRGLVKQVAEPVYAELKARGVLAGVGFSNAEGVKVDQRSQGYGYRVVGALAAHLIWLPACSSTVAQSTEQATWQLTTTLPNIETALQTQPADKICFAGAWRTLQNRFVTHPFRQYRFWVYRSADGTVMGVVVDRPTALLRLAGSSLLAVYGRDMTEVLRRWTMAIRAQGAHFVRVLATPCASALLVLRTLGLSIKLRPRQPHYLTVKPLQSTCPAGLFDFAQWDCLGGEVL